MKKIKFIKCHVIKKDALKLPELPEIWKNEPPEKIIDEIYDVLDRYYK